MDSEHYLEIAVSALECHCCNQVRRRWVVLDNSGHSVMLCKQEVEVASMDCSCDRLLVPHDSLPWPAQ